MEARCGSRKIFSLIFLANISLIVGRPDKEAMRDVTVGFGKVLEECREESGLKEEVMEEFVHFWRDDVQHREFGCAVFCMGTRLKVLDERGRMHHENMDAFVKSYPRGEVIAKQVLEISDNCEKKFDSNEDGCMRILLMAQCFKADCIEAGLAPTMDMLVEIIM